MKRFINFLLEIIFPSKRIEKRIREMSPDDFMFLKKVIFDKESGVWSFFNYRNPQIREAVWQMKYRGDRRVAKIFAMVIHEILLEELADLALFENFKKPLLVPIPMNKSEKRARGFNQTELLAEKLREVGRETYEYSPHCLSKIKNTKRQVELKRNERLENIQGAFGASKEVEGRNIILVDDVTTTGATLSEAKNVLRFAGAKNVLSVVVAR